MINHRLYGEKGKADGFFTHGLSACYARLQRGSQEEITAMKTILITGTTNGIGRVTALELAKQGHRLLLANRDRAKSEALKSEIEQQTGNSNVELFDLDLASLASVDKCAQAVKASCDSLDVLLNNAGLMSHQEVITADGYELQFAVNALAQFEFTLELLPLLEAGAPSQVIFVTSMMHKFGKLDYDSFRGWDKYNGGGSYNQSKLAMMLLARELAERLASKQIAVNTLHPGAVATGILDGYSRFAQFFLRLFFIAPEKGALTSLFLAESEPAQLPSGKYFVGKKEAATHKMVDDAAARSRLWDTCCQLLDRDVGQA
jgi:NAD(P)-dependent dehydrogenase (short-subunit alcohol dehydrogenase family)